MADEFVDEKWNFINDIKKRPAIWDHPSANHPHHHTFKCPEKNAKWEEMVDIYGGPNLKPKERHIFSQKIQKKWKNLRDNYVRFFRSNLEKPGARRSEYFQLMSFLDDPIRRKMGLDEEMKRKYIEVGQKEVEADFEKKKNIEVEGDFKKGNVDERDPSTRQTPQKRYREDNVEVGQKEVEGNFNKGNVDERDKSTRQTTQKRYRENNASESDLTGDDPFNNWLDDSTDHLKIKDTFSLADQNEIELTDAEKDECDVFGNLVSVKLRKLDQQARCRVQCMIYQTLFNAEMGRINDRTHMKSNQFHNS